MAIREGFSLARCLATNERHGVYGIHLGVRIVARIVGLTEIGGGQGGSRLALRILLSGATGLLVAQASAQDGAAPERAPS